MSYFFSVEDSSRNTQGTRVHCKKCDKETVYIRRKCVECGTAYVKKVASYGKPITMAIKRKLAYRAGILRNEKMAYYKRQAEESRAKFEGKK